ncbi:MAG: hypothetical protein ACO3UU_04935, partial [Minisyncoccia bacterium]
MSYTRKKIIRDAYKLDKKSTSRKNLPSKKQEKPVLINEMISKIEENLTDNNYISISIVECKEPTGVNYKVFKIDKNTYDGNINKPTSDLNPSNLQTAIDEFKKKKGFTKAHQDAKYSYFRLNLFYNENAVTKFNIEGIPIYQTDTYNYCPIGDSIFTEYFETQNTNITDDERIADEFMTELNEEENTRIAEEAERLRLAEEAEKARLAEEAERVRLAEAKAAEEARLAEAKAAEEARLAEEAEKARLAEEAERVRLAEEARLAAEKAESEDPIGIIMNNDSLDVEDKKLAVLLHLFNEILKNPEDSNNLKDEVYDLFDSFNAEFGEGTEYENEDNSKNLQNIFECILVNWPDNKDEQITRIKEERDSVKIIQVMKKIDNTNTYPNPEDMNKIIATLEEIDTIIDDEYDNIFKHMDSLSQEQSIENKKGHLLQVTSILKSHINRINPCMNNSVDEQVDDVTDTWTDVDGPDTESVYDDPDTLKEVEEPVDEPVKLEQSVEDEVEEEDIWKKVESKQGILDMIDEISNIVTIRKYKDNTELTVELTENMQSLKGFVDELHKLSSYLTPKEKEITSILGKQKCNIALNYINDNNTADVYNDHLDDDFTKVNIAYTTYIRYRTALFTDKFEEHKQKLISELANFKKNLIENVYSTFEYGDSEYCKDKRILDDKLIQSVEKANQQAERVLTRTDSMSQLSEDKSTTMLRSNSEPLIQMNKPTKPYTKAEIKIITNDIIWSIDRAKDYQTLGKDIFIRNIKAQINELLKDPDVKEEKRLRDIELHLTK